MVTRETKTKIIDGYVYNRKFSWVSKKEAQHQAQ